MTPDDADDDSGDGECARVSAPRVEPGEPDSERERRERCGVVLAEEGALSSAVGADEVDHRPGDDDAS